MLSASGRQETKEQGEEEWNVLLHPFSRMSEKEEEEVCPLRQPRSLALLAQVSVISQVHQVASKLEAGYIDLWLERELSPENRELEQKLDIRDPECDTGAVVRKFQSAQGELFRSAQGSSIKGGAGPGSIFFFVHLV